MNILLVNPPSSGIFKTIGFQMPPLSLLYLAAYLESQDYCVDIKDFCVEGRIDKKFNYSHYQIVGITTDTTRYPEALKIATLAKMKGCTVVMGGPHSHFLYEDVLNSGLVDYIVHGEGEIPFFELVDHLNKGINVDQVSGISFKKDGRVIRTAAGKGIEDLDMLPLPARHLITMSAYHITKLGNRSITSVTTSRGCPNNCSFCSSSQFFGKQWRWRSVPSIIEEIEEIYFKYNFKAVAFVDDNFTNNPQRVIDLAEEVMRRKLDLWWWNFSRVDTIVMNEEMVRTMARAGAKTIHIGIESANPETLKEFQKSIDPSMVITAINMLKKYDFNIFASYVFGGLSDTVNSINETIAFSIKLDTNIAQYTILTPYPGTKVYELVKKDIFNNKYGAYDGQHLVFKHKNVSVVRMYWLLLKANMLFYTRSKKAIRDLLYVLKRQRVFPTKIVHFIKYMVINS
jgi:anaerobic magnesium-protoporphyrin IX monomethyl ester cyclase